MSHSTRTTTFSGNDVPKLTKILYPWSGIFRDACYALIGTFLMQYAITSGVLSIEPAAFKQQYLVITIAMMIALLWDGINDPIMGFILEKCHFKAGKFRPWIEIGAVGNAVVVMLMFVCPMLFTGLRGWGYVAFMIVMYVLWDTFFTMNDIGYWSMLPALTNDAQQRAKLTTYTAIAASIGAFAMNIAMFVLPGSNLGSTMQIYMYAGIGVAALFLASQTIVFFLCKEKARDAEQEEVSEKSSILDLFRVLKKNKELMFAAIGMLLYYFSSFILTGIGQNYFYIVFGYGGGKGGIVATIISVFYVLGTVVAQAVYPMLAKKLSKKKILTIMTAIIVASYVAFFFTAFPIFGDRPLAYNQPTDNIFWAFGGTMSLLYVFAFLFFGAMGIFYLGCLVMFQDAIDYGEWKNGERKESICFAWRPLDVKLSSGLNRGLQYVVYFATGTMLAINAISNWEGISNALSNAAGGDQTLKNAVSAITTDRINAATSGVNSGQLVGFGAIVIGVILAAIIGSYLCLRIGYKLDEAKVKEIVDELNKKQQEAIPEETPVEEAAQ